MLLEGQYPLTKSKLVIGRHKLEDMVQRAKKLLRVVRPSALRRVSVQLDEAMNTQSRVWTLLLRQYDVVWAYGALVYGRRVEEYVPPLGSRVVVIKRKEEGVETAAEVNPA